MMGICSLPPQSSLVQKRAWRWLLHAVPMAYFAALLVWELLDITLEDAGSLLLSLLSIMFLALALWAYVRRGITDPARESGWSMRIVAFAAANLLLLLSFLPDQHPFWIPFALGSSALGLGLSLWAIFCLGSSFSIVPQAWRLVEGGPYRYVRHPMYLGSFLIGIGVLLVKLSPEAVMLLAAFIAAQWLRLRCEERLLSEALPGYAMYKARTKRIIPGLI